MGQLDEIIIGATDDSVTTSNLLRRVQIVAHHLGAEEIKAWAARELRGYDHKDVLPEYRSSIRTSVLGQWMTLSWQVKEHLNVGDLPDDFRDFGFRADLRQSLAELEQLSSGDNDAMIPWPGHLVVAYMQAAKRGLVTAYEDASLVNAHQILTRGVLLGVIDGVRNTALDFALVLQTANPDAGSVNGPTVSDAPVAQAVWHVTNNIYGDGAQLAHGENIRQRSKVVKGDLAGLLRAAEEAGLDTEGRDELARTVLSDEASRPSRVKTFLTKVGDGAFAIGTGMTADVAATQLSELISSYLG